MGKNLLYHWQKKALFFVGISIGMTIQTALAREGKLEVPLIPKDFAEVESFVKDDNSTIQKNLNAGLCGGWDTSQSIGTQLGLGVAEVTGVPGRKILENNPLNSKGLGMALKQDDFFFPENEGDTCGFVSACWPARLPENYARLKVNFYADNDYWQPCERPLDGIRPDDWSGSGDGTGTGNVNASRVNYSCGGGQMLDVSSDTDFCPTLFDNNASFINPSAGSYRTPDNQFTLSATTAGGLCQRLNEDFIYSLWRQPIVIPDYTSTNPCGPGFLVGWVFQKKGCTVFDDEGIKDAPVAENYAGTCPRAYQFDSYRYCCTDAVLGDAEKNCVACKGEECHKGITTDPISEDIWYIGLPAIATPYDKATPGTPLFTTPYYSFFRHYLGSFMRQKLQTGDGSTTSTPTINATKGSNANFDDSERLNLPIPCYGIWWWNESGTADEEYLFDPETKHSAYQWFRCVISSYYDNDRIKDKDFYKNNASDPNQMENTQAGKGRYQAVNWKTNLAYKDPPTEDEARKNTKTWMRDLSKGFSLLSGSLINEENNFDITESMMVPDLALQRATVQRYVPDKQMLADNIGTDNLNDPKVLEAYKDIVLSKGAIIRSFDDSSTYAGQNRPFTEWWQQVETTMNAYFTPPSVQLILPPGWSIDLDPLHPLLTPKLPKIGSGTWRSNPQYQTIDVQLELNEDLLGEVANYLEDSLLLQYTPSKIPIVIPTGSAKEFRALAQRWCSVAIEKGDATNCNAVSGDIGTLVTSLLEYADRIDQGRALRAQAMEINGKFLELHTKIQEELGQWVIDNTKEFLDFQDDIKERQDIKPLWQEVQQLMWKFHDETNQPWCMNQRFTAPIYSLLDTYPFDKTGWFPYISDHKDFTGASFPQLPEILPQAGIVFDASTISIGTGTLQIPEIEPMPIKIDTLQIGNAGPNSVVPTLPPLPPIPDFSSQFTEFIPKLLKSDNKPDTFGSKITLETYDDLNTPLNKIKTMLEKMDEAYTVFWGSVKIDPEDVLDGTEEDCYSPYSERCVHYEFDLYERLMRIGSRPNVYLKEDFEQIGTWRSSSIDSPYACLDKNFEEYKDWVCQVLSPVTISPNPSWRIELNGTDKQAEKIDEIRVQSFKESLQTNSSQSAVPLIVPREQILPSFNIPSAIEIFESQVHSSSSTSSFSS